MKKGKKALSLFLSILMILTCVPFVPFASAEEADGNNINVVGEGTVDVTNNGSTLSLTPIAAPGYHFDGFYETAGNSIGTCSTQSTVLFKGQVTLGAGLLLPIGSNNGAVGPFNCSGYENGYLALRVYVDSVAKIAGKDGQIEITSSGKPDVQELSINFRNLISKDGWQTVYYPLSQCANNAGLNFSNINYIRAYNFGTGTIKFEDLRLVKEKPVINDYSKALSENSILLANEINIPANQVNYFGTFSPLDCTKYQNGYLSFVATISDVNNLPADGQIEITSSGKPDVGEIAFAFKDCIKKSGTYRVFIPMSSNHHDSGIDFSNVNYIRAYNFGTAAINLKDVRFVENNAIINNTIDDLRMYDDVETVLLNDCNNSSQWTNGATTQQGYNTGIRVTSTETRNSFEAKDISSFKNGYLSLQVYVDNVSSMNPNQPHVLELTSSGAPDVQELEWKLLDYVKRSGWQRIYLPLNLNDYINLSNVNFMRFYVSGSAGYQFIFDDIRVVSDIPEMKAPSYTYKVPSYAYTLSAKFTPNSYAVSFDANGAVGGEVPSSSSHIYGETFTIPTNVLEHDDLVFVGWNTKADGTGDSYALGQEANFVTENCETITLYAEFDECSVSFDTGAGGVEGILTDTFTLPTVSDPEKKFAGWYVGDEFIGFAGEEVSFADIYAISNTAATELTAKWVDYAPGEAFDVTYNSNDGTNQTYREKINIADGNLSPNQFTRENYDFAGWNTRPDNSGYSYADGAEIMPATNSFEARYVKVACDGSTIDSLHHIIEVEVYANDASGNIALGKPVIGSGNDLEKITDGYLEGEWGVSNDIVIDLGDVYDVNSVKLYRYWGDTRIYNDTVVAISSTVDFTPANTYVLFNSDKDGSIGFGGGTDAYYHDVSSGRTFYASTQKASSMRIYANGTTINNVDSHNYFVEVEAIAEDGTNVALNKTGDNMTDGLHNDMTAFVRTPDTIYQKQIDFGEVVNLKEIKLWTYWADRAPANLVIVTSENGTYSEDDIDILYNGDTDNFFGFGNGKDGIPSTVNAGSNGLSFVARDNPIARSTKASALKILTNGTNFPTDTRNYIVEVEAISSDGTNVALGRTGDKITDGYHNSNTEFVQTATGEYELQIDFDGVKNIEKVNLWTYWGDDRRLTDLVVLLSENGTFTGDDVEVLYNADTNNTFGYGYGTDSTVKPTAEGKSFYAKGKEPLCGGFNLYAQWSQVSVAFDTNGDGTVDETFSGAKADTFTLPDVSRQYYKSNGWKFGDETIGVAGDEVTFGSIFDKSGSLENTLVADWELEARSTLDIDLVGGELAEGQTMPETDRQLIGTVITMPTVEREGYIFVSWNTESVSNGSFDADTLEYTFGGDTSIIDKISANWLPITYTVIFNGNGATDNIPEALEKTYDAPAAISDMIPLRAGYTFMGWSAEQDGEVILSAGATIEEGADLSSVNNSEVTLYAAWAQNESTLTIDPNGGVWEDSTEPQSFTQLSATTKAAIADPEREGYDFIGWELDSENGSFNAENDNTYTFGDGTEAVTMTAKWEIRKYTITFVDYDNTVIAALENVPHFTDLSDYAETPADPERAADDSYTYAFDGWYDGAEKGLKTVTGEATYKANYNSTFIVYDTTLTAEDGATVEFANKPADGYHYGDSATVRATLGKDGIDGIHYIFDGWYVPETDTLVSTDLEFTYTIQEYTALEARVTLKTYNVKFVDDKGNLLYENTINGGDSITYPYATPVKEADSQKTYTFAGWVTTDATVDENVISDISKNTTVRASFTSADRTYTVVFKNYDGKVLKVVTDAKYGAGIVNTYGESVEPIKPADGETSYTFKGWDRGNVVADVEVTALYQPSDVISAWFVNYKTYDGNIVYRQLVPMGRPAPDFPESEKALLAKPSDNLNMYEFARWSISDLSNVQKNYEVQAEYTSIPNPQTSCTHSFVLAENATATCAAAATKVYTCETCGYAYTVVTAEKTAHSFDAAQAQTVDQAGCRNLSVTTNECTVCGYIETVYGAEFDSTAHGETYETGYIAASCQEDGKENDTYCKACGEMIAEGAVIEKLSEDGTCEYVIDTTKAPIPATCNHGTISYYYCVNCNAPKQEDDGILNPENHSGSEYIKVGTARPANCAVEGYEGDIYCSGCDTKLRDGSVVEKTTDHHWEDFAYIPADCVTVSTTTQRCSICNEAERFIYGTSTDSNTHKGPTISANNARPATCVEDGKTNDQICAACRVVVQEGQIIPKGPQYHVKSSIVAHTDANCAAVEYTKYHCDVCGGEFEEYGLEKNYANHIANARTQVTKQAQAATCTTAGWTEELTCLECNHIFKESVSISATGIHIFEDTVVAPTCTANGYTRRTCTACGQTEQMKPTEALGHSFGNWMITSPAVSCIVPGVQARTCTRCNDIETQPYYLGHVPSESNPNVCANCGKNVDSGTGGGSNPGQPDNPGGSQKPTNPFFAWIMRLIEMLKQIVAGFKGIGK